MIGVFLINMLLCMLLVSCFFTKVRYLPVCTTMYFSQREVSEYRKGYYLHACVQFLYLTSDGDMRFEFFLIGPNAKERRRRKRRVTLARSHIKHEVTSYTYEVTHEFAHFPNACQWCDVVNVTVILVMQQQIYCNKFYKIVLS